MRAHVVYNQVQPELCKQQLVAADVRSCAGVIVNREQPGILMKGRHWFAVVNSAADSSYYNYDSKLQSPERIGDEAALVEWLLAELRDSKGQAFFVAPIEPDAGNDDAATIEQHTPFSDTNVHTEPVTATRKTADQRTVAAIDTAISSGDSKSAAAAADCQSAEANIISYGSSSSIAHTQAHTTGGHDTESTGTSDRSDLQQATDRIASLAL
jgi:Josephin